MESSFTRTAVAASAFVLFSLFWTQSSRVTTDITEEKAEVGSASKSTSKTLATEGKDGLFISFATGLPAEDIVKLARAQRYFAPKSHVALYVQPTDIDKIQTALRAQKVPVGFVELIDPGTLFGGDPMWAKFNIALRKQGIKNSGYRKACYIYTKRFYKVHEYLRQHPQYTRVIMADARDIMLQGDPFAQITDPLGVYAFTEHSWFRDDPKFNQVWAKQCYGSNWVKEILNKKIVCAGVLMGGINGMLRYFEAFEVEFEKVGACTASTDTAIHGRLLRKVLPASTNGPNVHIEESESARSMHLPLVSEWNGAISIDDEGTVRNAKGVPYLLVHLADRNKGLFKKYTLKWGMSQ